MKDKKRKISIVALLLMASFLPMKGNTKAKPLQEHKNNLSVSSYPSPQTIKGIVQDQKGVPLIGVSVIAKGTTQGTGTFQALRRFNWTWGNTFNYNKTFGGYVVTGLLGYYAKVNYRIQ